MNEQYDGCSFESDNPFSHYPEIPERLTRALWRWVEFRVPPGGFLQHVLANDLAQAILRADKESLECLASIVRWLHNDAPSGCHGSPQAVWIWCEPDHRPSLEIAGLKTLYPENATIEAIR